MPRALSVVVLIYRAAVHLYPPDFRKEFASEMTRDFQQATHEAWVEGAWRRLPGLWAHMGADLAGTLVLQWLRSRWAAIALIPVTCLLVGIGAAAQLLPAAPVPTPMPEQDRDLIALILLVTAVLLIVAATIILTLVFTRRMRYRPRL